MHVLPVALEVAVTETSAAIEADATARLAMCDPVKR
jgi:hypothetical protein